MQQNKNFIKHNTLFGLFIGGSFIMTSLIFIATNKSIVLNPNLNNLITLLSISGIFLGIKQFRDKWQNGYISYGRAYLTGMYIINIAALTYTLYIYIIYSTNPELMAHFKKIMLAILKQSYGDSTLYSTMEESLNHYFFPISIAAGEFFNKIFLGCFFTLILAGFLRKSDNRKLF